TALSPAMPQARRAHCPYTTLFRSWPQHRPPYAGEATQTPGYHLWDMARWVPEPKKSTYRSDFERDRARILHSAALRRLAAKTQRSEEHTSELQSRFDLVCRRLLEK